MKKNRCEVKFTASVALFAYSIDSLEWKFGTLSDFQQHSDLFVFPNYLIIILPSSDIWNTSLLAISFIPPNTTKLHLWLRISTLLLQPRRHVLHFRHHGRVRNQLRLRQTACPPQRGAHRYVRLFLGNYRPIWWNRRPVRRNYWPLRRNHRHVAWSHRPFWWNVLHQRPAPNPPHAQRHLVRSSRICLGYRGQRPQNAHRWVPLAQILPIWHRHRLQPRPVPR